MAGKFKIVDEDGNEVEQGKVGELIIKGPGVMTCYDTIILKQPKRFLKTDGYIQEIWHRWMKTVSFILLTEKKT